MTDQDSRSELINDLGEGEWVQNLIDAGFSTGSSIANAQNSELLAVEGVAGGRLEKLRDKYGFTGEPAEAPPAPDTEPDEPGEADEDAPEAVEQEIPDDYPHKVIEGVPQGDTDVLKERLGIGRPTDLLIDRGFPTVAAVTFASDEELLEAVTTSDAEEDVAKGEEYLALIREHFPPLDPPGWWGETEEEEAEPEPEPWADVPEAVLALHRQHVLENLPASLEERMRDRLLEEFHDDLRTALGKQIYSEVRDEVIPKVKEAEQDKLIPISRLSDLRFKDDDGDGETVYYLMQLSGARGSYQVRVFHRGD